MIIIYIFLSIVLLRIIINLSNLYSVSALHDKFDNHIKLMAKNKPTSFIKFKRKTADLFKEAGIKEWVIPYQEPVGYGKIASAMLKGFDYIDYPSEYIMKIVWNSFIESREVFKTRILESFNPLFWIKYFLQLPQKLGKYLGLSPESLSIKIANVIWWIFLSLISLIKFGFEIGLFKI